MGQCELLRAANERFEGARPHLFLLADHLGSTSTVLSAAGAVEQSQKYYPFGGVRSGSVTLTDKQFTGQQKEPGYWGWCSLLQQTLREDGEALCLQTDNTAGPDSLKSAS